MGADTQANTWTDNNVVMIDSELGGNSAWNSTSYNYNVGAGNDVESLNLGTPKQIMCRAAGINQVFVLLNSYEWWFDSIIMSAGIDAGVVSNFTIL